MNLRASNYQKMKNHLELLLGICVVAGAFPAFAEAHFDRALFAPQGWLG